MICFVPKFYTYTQKENLKNKVSTCVQGYIGGHSSAVDLLHNTQHQLNIPSQHRLFRSENDPVTEILNLYRKDLNAKFLNNTLLHTRYITKMNDTEYFFFTFYNFFYNHSCDTDLGKNEILTLKHKENGAHGRYDAEYTLTDFGVIFYKLYHLALSYCETNSHINQNNFRGSDGIKSILDTQKVTISKL